MCSNPECRVPTSAPCGRDRVTSIGVAAHIHAAAPGGKRYLEEMTREQRMHLDNGIWLCSNCSILIDRDAELFSADKLRAWRDGAEQRAMRALGKPPSNPADALTTLFEAMEQKRPKNLAQAISQAHRDQENFLVRLDPRFAVKSLVSPDGRPYVEIRAKEDVKVKLRVQNEPTRNYSERLQNLIDHGSPLEINLEHASAQGSDLISHLFSEGTEAGGNIVFTPHPHSANARLELIDPKTKLIEFFTELPAEITSGKKSMQINGNAFEGLLQLTVKKSLCTTNQAQSVAFTVDFDKWENLPLARLPYLNKISKLYRRLSDGWVISLTVEHKGEELLSGEGDFAACIEQIEATNRFMAYTLNARSVSMLLGQPLKFTKNVTFSNRDIAQLDDIRMTLDNQGQFIMERMKNAIDVGLIYDDSINQFEVLSPKLPGTIRLVENEGELFHAFGQALALPKRILIIENIRPKINMKKKTWKNGEIIDITLLPSRGYRITAIYDQNP